jgi:predicted nucleic acid-binding protein
LIFVDTSFWVAAHMRRDAHHEEALQLLARERDERLVTSNNVRAETWTFLRRRSGHVSAVAFLDMLAATRRVDVVLVDPDVENRALRWLRQHDEREYSFVDATSFALMRSLRLRSAFAFDGDFAAAGFTELRF